MSRLRFALAALALGLSAIPASAVTLLSDSFDDGVLGTNTLGIGSGFAPAVGVDWTYTEVGPADSILAPWNVNYVEAGGKATISGPPVLWQIQSRDTFDPRNKQLTVNLDTTMSSGDGLSGAFIGFVVPGTLDLSRIISLELRSDRIVFDVLATGPYNYGAGRYVSVQAGDTTPGAAYAGPAAGISATITFLSDLWSVKVTGPGTDVRLSGPYSPGHSFAELGGLPPMAVTLGLVGFDRGRDSVSFDSVIMTAVPEPATSALFATGALLLAAGARRRRASLAP